MIITPAAPARLRRKTYYIVNLIATQPGSGFSAVGPVPGGAPGLTAGILRPMRGAGGADFGPFGLGPVPPYADGADVDQYGNLLPLNDSPGSSANTDVKAKNRITALFECGETDSNGLMAHACIQFIAPTDAVTALSAPALDDPSTLPRVFVRLLFLATANLGGRVYFQKQHSLEA